MNPCTSAHGVRTDGSDGHWKRRNALAGTTVSPSLTRPGSQNSFGLIQSFADDQLEAEFAQEFHQPHVGEAAIGEDRYAHPLGQRFLQPSQAKSSNSLRRPVSSAL